MKELVIISGKGGTGKTSLTAAFALLAESPVLCDADVDAADLHLLLRPVIEKHHEFSGGSLASIVTEQCTECGLCVDLCRFEAISQSFVIDPIECEGCGVCADFCPENAIAFSPQKSGDWYTSTTSSGPMVHARLGIGEENSGKLVSLIRREARQLAEQQGHSLLITDGPPGIGCPVIASVSGADLVAIIVEPTVSGKHDVERVLGLTRHFGIQSVVCVNRWDINEDMTLAIEQHCMDEQIPLLPRIPFDPLFVEAMVAGKTIVEYAPESATSSILKGVWSDLLTHMASVKSSPKPLQSFIANGAQQNETNANCHPLCRPGRS